VCHCFVEAVLPSGKTIHAPPEGDNQFSTASSKQWHTVAFSYSPALPRYLFTRKIQAIVRLAALRAMCSTIAGTMRWVR